MNFSSCRYKQEVEEEEKEEETSRDRYKVTTQTFQFTSVPT